MKKNLFLNVFTVLLLLSTSFGGSSANAADPGDGLQFCFLAKNVDGKQRLEFRQKTDSEPTAIGEECYDFWSGDGSAVFVIACDGAVRNPVVRCLQDKLLVLRRVRNCSLVVRKFASLPMDFRNALFPVGNEDCRRVQLRDSRVGRRVR